MPATARLRPRSGATRPAAPGATNGASAPVAAQRLSAARWRQPRLVLGVLLIAAAVVLGARAFAALDDRVLVWRVESAARAGSPAAELDVRAVPVRFDDSGTESAYLPADVPLPTTGVVAEPLVAGELLSVSDVQPASARSAGQLPLDVPAGSVPLDIAVGDRVDVWVVPGSPGGAPVSGTTGNGDAPVPTQAVRVLDAVRVAAVTAPGATVGDTRQLVVDLPGRDVDRLDEVLGRLAAGSPVAVRVPPPAP